MKNAGIQLTDRVINKFNWEKSFKSKSIPDQVYFFNK